MALLIKKRSYFSRQHLEAAAFCARQSKKVESSHSGKEIFSSEHRTHVTGAVFFSVASLEAFINELFADAADGILDRLRPLDDVVVSRMADMWKAGVPRTARYAVLEKYAIALTLADRPALPKGKEPWQSAASLARLRNALVHYEPEWVRTDAAERAEMHRFEGELKDKFALNPLTGLGNPFYPDKLLGHGCAAWAVVTVLNFVDAFVGNMGLLIGSYERQRAELATE